MKRRQWGRTAPMTGHNVEAKSDLFVYRELTDQEKDFYADQGYLNLGRLLTERGVRQMLDEVMSVWTAEKGPANPDKTWLENALRPDIHHCSDAVRKYYFSGPLVDIAEHLIGPNIKGATSQLTFKMRGNTMPFPWHQDNAYGELDPYNALTCLTALDDTDLDNGCLWIIPGSHKQGQLAFARSKVDRAALRPVEMKANEKNAIPVPMKAGDCLVFHCHMMHRSEGNRSKDRDRRVLFLRYADADAVEVYNDRKPRLGRLIRGTTIFPAVEAFEADLPLD
ncbi:phytanoyl-CoA dioxygenase family protein [Bythopirellula goksoeyrii]|nr:phytanoyl-CoA dioxygenase family protein [Bythopirellula goksoeyrii]